LIPSSEPRFPYHAGESNVSCVLMHIVVIGPSRTVPKCMECLLESRDHHTEALRYIDSDANVDAAIISAEQILMSDIELYWQTRLPENLGSMSARTQ
jgi:hypothetical protein